MRARARITIMWLALNQIVDLNLSYRDYSRDDAMLSWWWATEPYCSYEYDTVGFNPQYILDNQLFGKDNRLTVGMEMYNTNYNAWTGPSKALVKTTHFDHDQKTLGVYLQDEFNLMKILTPLFKKLQFLKMILMKMNGHGTWELLIFLSRDQNFMPEPTRHLDFPE